MKSQSSLLIVSLRGARRATKQSFNPIVAVGTTSCRVLESVAQSKAYSGSTDIFIYPSYKFQIVDALITNFHLPYSTLLMLVCAFGGYDLQVRLQLTNDLINQQSNDLKELDEKYFSSIRPPQSSSNDNSRFD